METYQMYYSLRQRKYSIYCVVTAKRYIMSECVLTGSLFRPWTSRRCYVIPPTPLQAWVVVYLPEPSHVCPLVYLSNGQLPVSDQGSTPVNPTMQFYSLALIERVENNLRSTPRRAHCQMINTFS